MTALLSILEGTGENLHEPINSLTCTEMNSINFKYTSKHFTPIGGLYVCFMGPENMSDDGLNSMKAMHFCKLILDENETIGYMPQITLLNIKVLNRTANLIQGESKKFSRIWQPIFIGSKVSHI